MKFTDMRYFRFFFETYRFEGSFLHRPSPLTEPRQPPHRARADEPLTRIGEFSWPGRRARIVSDAPASSNWRSRSAAWVGFDQREGRLIDVYPSTLAWELHRHPTRSDADGAARRGGRPLAPNIVEEEVGEDCLCGGLQGEPRRDPLLLPDVRAEGVKQQQRSRGAEERSVS
jgi:hypothetical protein